MYRVSSLPVESIDRAVTLVGVQGIRSIIATALLQPVMASGIGRLQPISRTGLGAHAVFAPSAAEMYAVQIERCEPFISQLVGLLYGLSAIVVFRIVRDQFAAHPQLEPEPGEHGAHARNLGGAHRRAHRRELGIARTGAVRARKPDAGGRTAAGEFAGHGR